MTLKKNIFVSILLLIYLLVLLHNVFPHHHHDESDSHNCTLEKNEIHEHTAKRLVHFILYYHHKDDTADKSLACHFSDSFSKSNLANDFISSCNLSGIRFFANITNLQFDFEDFNLIHSYYNPLSSRAPPIV